MCVCIIMFCATFVPFGFISIYIYIYIIKYETLPPAIAADELAASHAQGNVYCSHSCQRERNTIVLRVFLLIMNPTEIRLVRNQRESSHYDRFLLNLKGIRKGVISVQMLSKNIF